MTAGTVFLSASLSHIKSCKQWGEDGTKQFNFSQLLGPLDDACNFPLTHQLDSLLWLIPAPTTCSSLNINRIYPDPKQSVPDLSGSGEYTVMPDLLVQTTGIATYYALLSPFSLLVRLKYYHALLSLIIEISVCPDPDVPLLDLEIFKSRRHPLSSALHFHSVHNSQTLSRPTHLLSTKKRPPDFAHCSELCLDLSELQSCRARGISWWKPAVCRANSCTINTKALYCLWVLEIALSFNLNLILF